ncbi:MAG: amino acid permease [Lewinella sp.]|nr:amino acid permease [Lewinella sp.]
MDQDARRTKIEPELSRDLGLISTLAIGIGTMIAAGIFTLSGLAIRNVGSAAIVSFLLAAIVALFTALTYCEFVSIYPRTGEGYLYARKTFPAPLAYFVGWALFLGYASSCAFYIASLSSYFNEFIYHLPIEALFGVIMLIGLTLLNIKGTKESGRFQVIVTAAKIVLLIWFIFGGLQYVNMPEVLDKFSDDLLMIGSTAAMVFITFFGFSAIAASAGEVKDPVKTIPRAIFISMGVVTLLYTLVVLVVLFAGLTEYTESSMGAAAQRFLGSWGGYVIIGGAIFSMVSASNASIMAGSRVVLSMSQLRHLPREIGTINVRTRTPIVAVVLVGGAILIFAIILPLEDLSYFANTVLLLALILVNAALIVHRRKYPDMERPFRVPLVPLLPALGIVANLYLVGQIVQHTIPFFLALGTMAVGMLAFVAWKGAQAEEEAIEALPSHIALSHGRGTDDPKRFRILLPVANPNNLEKLIQMAAALAREKDGEVLLLRVVTVPEQLPPTSYDEAVIDEEEAFLKRARHLAERYEVPSHSLIRVGHDIARAILETARQHAVSLILLGWKGYSSSRERILGSVTDAVVTHARADIMLVKIMGEAPLQRILLPTAGGEHAQWAEQYGANFAHAFEGELTLCQVITEASANGEKQQGLDEAMSRIRQLQPGITLDSQLVRNPSVSKGIIEAATDYDTVMLGAAGQSFNPKVMFGNIPEEVARETDKTVIVVKHYNTVKALVGRVMADE